MGWQLKRAVHQEKHFTSSETVRDVVIGMSDGLTVPFALAAGLSGAVAVNATHLIITAGLAEIVAGSIAMGLGGYLAAKTDMEHYQSERAREDRETHEIPDEEKAEVAAVLRAYGLDEAALKAAVDAISSDRTRWVDFMMRFELGLEKPDAGRAPQSALTIGAAYAVGGLVPLVPYMLAPNVGAGLIASCAFTLIALVIFGAIKSKLTGSRPLQGAWQTTLIGAIAAGVAYGLARLISPAHA